MADSEDEKKATSSDFYHDPKAMYSTHELLIKDRIRQNTFSECIAANRHHLYGKTVMVVGSGLGLLCLQMARDGGAARVIGVDRSKIVRKARQIAADNNLDEVCTYYQGSLAEGFQVPVEPNSVDVILCEWVGGLLTNDPILADLIAARERYLTKDGVMIPDQASLHVSTCQDQEYRDSSIGYWDNVYGFKMSCMAELVEKSAIVSAIHEYQSVSNTYQLRSLDTYTLTSDDRVIDEPFVLYARGEAEFVHYMVTYVVYRFHREGWRGFTLSTSPSHATTHLQQTCFTLKEELAVNGGDAIRGRFRMTPSELTSAVRFDIELDGAVHKASYSQDFEFRN
eukprot:TRINITY_DN30437_c0_g1_i1.p1 TRINITY_DN30437_c0_g1~~TRINITY_DN30437_c0_g1_i1.p1  ORF type:complete len:362 (+),score=141.42 TRINITY_DN30437_c0_g1_i1:70-1086(+)